MKVSMTMPQSRRCCATLDGAEVQLSPHQHCALETMLLSRPLAASMDTLISAIWPHPDYEPENVVGQIRIYVVALRKRGFPVAHAGYGKGYMLPDLLTGDEITTLETPQ